MNRQEWLKWRRAGIGGSDLPIIMGVSEHMTPLQLWEQKTSTGEIVETQNFVTDRGNRFEPKIRALVNIMFGKNFEPKLVALSDPNWARCSLDGADGDKILEIKTAGKEDHQGVREGKVPEKYMPQVQWALLVSGASSCLYASYNDPDWIERLVIPANLETIEVFPDPVMQAKLIEEATKFRILVDEKKPPLLSDGDFLAIRGHGALVRKYKMISEKLEHYQLLAKDCEEELLEIAKNSGHTRVSIGGITFSQFSKSGSIDYAAFAKSKATAEELEKFRKKGTTYWKQGEAKE